MEWSIYVILGFIYWKDLKLMAFCYLAVISATICWFTVDELKCHNRCQVGGENYDI